mgnify:CR=1 FL=1
MVKYKVIIGTIIAVLFGSCKKEPATEIDELFIGVWVHNYSTLDRKYISIKSNSKGHIVEYENNTSKSDTQNRKWLIKNNHLYFGWTGSGDEKFSIDQYPMFSTDTIIDNFDTIYPNQKYMILDGYYYVD